MVLERFDLNIWNFYFWIFFFELVKNSNSGTDLFHSSCHNIKIRDLSSSRFQIWDLDHPWARIIRNSSFIWNKEWISLKNSPLTFKIVDARLDSFKIQNFHGQKSRNFVFWVNLRPLQFLGVRSWEKNALFILIFFIFDWNSPF